MLILIQELAKKAYHSQSIERNWLDILFKQDEVKVFQLNVLNQALFIVMITWKYLKTHLSKVL